MKYNCKECGYHWVTNLNSSLICRNFTVLLSYYVIKFFCILLEEPLAWKASRKIKHLVLKSRLARKIKFRLWQVIVEKEASPLTMMINKIATKQLEVRWETRLATQPGRQTVELRDNDDDDGPYIISYGGFVSSCCLPGFTSLYTESSLRQHTTLHPSWSGWEGNIFSLSPGPSPSSSGCRTASRGRCDSARSPPHI